MIHGVGVKLGVGGQDGRSQRQGRGTSEWVELGGGGEEGGLGGRTRLEGEGKRAGLPEWEQMADWSLSGPT